MHMCLEQEEILNAELVLELDPVYNLEEFLLWNKFFELI